ncbi:LAGLIDADG family homing endonuclease [Streptomyces sp. NBC_00441]|uniref:LAGLIDADG family homing endonuclease n=1 Tax=Streptomyces sp. NBC_00441 TaxID=2975742 RepID=UPI002E288C2A|nr:LAGLIDADG family homing endonuclease [Streptomyces sp. NBC_00441]
MRALTIRQPHAYLAGVLRGDAWLNACLCLRVADRDFAEAFAQAIRTGYGCTAKVTVDERGYFLVRRHSAGRFESLKDFRPETAEAQAAWLRGYFDSEGNAQLTPAPSKGARSYSRRVSFYSTNEETLHLATSHLSDFGLATRRQVLKPSKGHLGKLPVHELALRSSKHQYATFTELVGSSIERKRVNLTRIVESYCGDLSAVRREMQARGVASRNARRDAGGSY